MKIQIVTFSIVQAAVMTVINIHSALAFQQFVPFSSPARYLHYHKNNLFLAARAKSPVNSNDEDVFHDLAVDKSLSSLDGPSTTGRTVVSKSHESEHERMMMQEAESPSDDNSKDGKVLGDLDVDKSLASLDGRSTTASSAVSTGTTTEKNKQQTSASFKTSNVEILVEEKVLSALGVDKSLASLEGPSTAATDAVAMLVQTRPHSSDSRILPRNWLGEQIYILSTAALIGVCTGTNIAIFKKGVEFVRESLYGDGITFPLLVHSLGGEELMMYSLKMNDLFPVALIPAIGGLGVGILLKFGGDMPPGLRDTVREVDLDAIRASKASPPQDLLACTKNVPPLSERNDFARFSRKALAATATLGTGNSLGPEGPSVEAGMSLSRLIMNNEIFGKLAWVFGTLEDKNMTEVQRVNRKLARDRLLLACGAAAGVSAGFNAPLSGVFFALEIVQNALTSIDISVSNVTIEDETQYWSEMDYSTASDNSFEAKLTHAETIGGEALAFQQINISAILLASVISALTIQLLLGSELALRLGTFDFKNPLMELPLYLLLGAMSGVVAAIFSSVAQFSKGVFDGEEGPEFVQQAFQSLPKAAQPVIASLICGFVSIYIPQVLFFGYETLNGLFLNSNMATKDLFILLIAKLTTTAISASSGLVGGTFAPSLFLGGVLGAGFHNIVSDALQSVLNTYPDFLKDYPYLQSISGLPAFAMVGAASVLSALFRAPLTASLLLFECTRNYDVILPLMASAGVASLTGDIVEKWLDEEQRESDPVSWGDLATRINGENENEDVLCDVSER
mmetsp:Transcript_33793/g.69442  ORF Transcript_33793/g.69442 Transcript_33793/m.69442 type:complete len:795 (+) Transcript_33793:57-2441(+)